MRGKGEPKTVLVVSPLRRFRLHSHVSRLHRPASIDVVFFRVRTDVIPNCFRHDLYIYSRLLLVDVDHFKRRQLGRLDVDSLSHIQSNLLRRQSSYDLLRRG